MINRRMLILWRTGIVILPTGASLFRFSRLVGVGTSDFCQAGLRRNSCETPVAFPQERHRFTDQYTIRVSTDQLLRIGLNPAVPDKSGCATNSAFDLTNFNSDVESVLEACG